MVQRGVIIYCHCMPVTLPQYGNVYGYKLTVIKMCPPPFETVASLAGVCDNFAIDQFGDDCSCCIICLNLNRYFFCCQAQRGLQILHDKFLDVDVDVRFRCSVEQFTIQMISQGIDIQVGGMFSIDHTLLYSVSLTHLTASQWTTCLKHSLFVQIVTSTITYLLILIQFELNSPNQCALVVNAIIWKQQNKLQVQNKGLFNPIIAASAASVENSSTYYTIITHTQVLNVSKLQISYSFSE